MKRFKVLFIGTSIPTCTDHYDREMLDKFIDAISPFMQRGQKNKFKNYIEDLEKGKRDFIRIDLEDGYVEIELTPEFNRRLN